MELINKRRGAVIRSHLWAHVHLVTSEPGRIEFRPEPTAPRDLANRLGQLLGEWTGARWIVAVSQAEGAPSLAQQEARRASALRDEIAAHPLGQAAAGTLSRATIPAAGGGLSAAAAAGPDQGG